jgi:UDP-N-acetylglucosamine 2-epimerase (non-hydrolysing)
MRTITAVTGARSDYGILRPILSRIAADANLRLELMVTGMHLSPAYGLSVRQIEEDGYPIRDRIDSLLSADTPQAVAQSMGLTVLGFSQAFARSTPELLLLLGDRTETLAAAVAALPFRIPIVHVHGGEVTEGAIDDAARHCVTKLAHVHCVSTADFARRVIQLGEPPSRVHVTGAPGLDAILETPLFSTEEFRERFGISLDSPPLVVTFHPVTQEFQETDSQITRLLEALAQFDLPIVFTYPNSDTSGQVIIKRIDEFVRQSPRAKAVVNLGSRGYFTLMSQARAMVGNSSSGIIEAASFGLPVVNVGSRQHGRPQPANVLQSSNDAQEIATAIGRALSPAFRTSIDRLENPYGDGRAAARIVDILKHLELSLLPRKAFHDLTQPTIGRAA